MADIFGTCDDRFHPMRELLSNSVDSGGDLGASVAVTLDGELVVDMWAGWTDTDKTMPWQRDTITNVWSTTKTMTSLSALLLIERGDLDPYARVSKYWPEFAANGKQDIEVRHLMSHTSGVSAWAQPVQVADIYDWEKSTSMLAAQAPWWEPGTVSGYHALNQGHLVGEVVRRITGLQLGAFFAKEIAGPMVADFHIGLDPSQFHRVSNVVPPPPLPIDLASLDMDSVLVKTFTGPAPDAATAWTMNGARPTSVPRTGMATPDPWPPCRRSWLAKARSVASGFFHRRPVRASSISSPTDPTSYSGEALRFGIGYALPHPTTTPYLPDGRVCYWGGWGGSAIIIDLDRRMTIAYMMNRMEEGLLGDRRGEHLITAAYGAVGRA